MLRALLRPIKPLVPRALVSLIRPDLITFEGDYRSWDAACADSEGFETAPIVASAVRAAAAPDATCCPRTEQLLTAITRTGLSRLRVLDVGGASGHYFHKLRPHLDLDWTVVETPAMVAALASFAQPGLRFTTEAQGDFDLVLLSGVVQYVADPYALIAQYVRRSPFVLFNRVPLIERDRLTVQRIKGGVGYTGSYPAWFLSEERFLDDLPAEPLVRWDSAGDVSMLDGQEIQYQGMLVRSATG